VVVLGPPTVALVYGIVITTGDQVPVADAVAVAAAVTDVGFNAAQVAVELATVAPQKYPHMGTIEPSGIVTVVGAAVRLTACGNVCP
jgi:sulfur carrier protein ThiS